MTLARPLFLVFALAGTALAAENPSASTSSDSLQIAITQAVEQPSGLIYSVAKARVDGQPPVADPPLAKLDGNVCYTMRMYKLKPTERLSDGERVSRAYTTCEMASNYQYRSAVAHPREVQHLTNNAAGK
jgi:hypothetical protein